MAWDVRCRLGTYISIIRRISPDLHLRSFHDFGDCVATAWSLPVCRRVATTKILAVDSYNWRLVVWVLFCNVRVSFQSGYYRVFGPHTNVYQPACGQFKEVFARNVTESRVYSLLSFICLIIIRPQQSSLCSRLTALSRYINFVL